MGYVHFHYLCEVLGAMVKLFDVVVYKNKNSVLLYFFANTATGLLHFVYSLRCSLFIEMLTYVFHNKSMRNYIVVANNGNLVSGRKFLNTCTIYKL